MNGCRWCTGGCADTDLGPLLSSELTWLWEQIGQAADRRGDALMSTGALTVSAPVSAEQRHAAVGLLGGRLRAGQRRKVDLAVLTHRLQVRGDGIVPGVVAAHALRRRLALRAEAEARLTSRENGLRATFEAAMATLPAHTRSRLGPDTAWERVKRSGTITWLVKRHDAEELLSTGLMVVSALPDGGRVDRRTLVPGSPHALDNGTPLARLVLGLTGQAAALPRHAWHELGVDMDNLTGGLLTLGIHPRGWNVPDTSVLTLPPRELDNVEWPAPGDSQRWVFVTENPSVVAAAADLVACHQTTKAAEASGRRRIRLLCTVGTPSNTEVRAVAALAGAGWRVAVRADFDVAGVGHVRAMLNECPDAVPWRMDERAYLEVLEAPHPGCPLTGDPGETPWDVGLAVAMRARNQAVFEEDLLAALLNDLQVGSLTYR